VQSGIVMQNLSIPILAMIADNLGDTEWATFARVNKEIHEACSIKFNDRREQYDIGGKYLKNILRGMFPEQRVVDEFDSFEGQYNYKKIHPFGIDRLVINQTMLSIAITKNENAYNMSREIIEPLLERMFPPTNRSKSRGACEPDTYTSGDVKVFITKYIDVDGGLGLYCINVFWLGCDICFTTL
jgi:hypothetical protein